MRLGSLAVAAMEQGDMAGAGKALIMSYDQIPDGRTVHGGVDQSGNGTINIVDTRTGKAVQQMQVTPQLLKMAAMKLSDGSEFYSHLSRMAPQKSAAPQRQAALPAYYTGGPVEDQDVDPAMYGEDAADAEVARDASLSASSEDSPEEDLPAVGAVETSGAVAPGGAVPTPPEYVDMTGMNTAQRAQATAVNRQRAQAYTQEMQNYRQGEVTARQNQARIELEQSRQRAAGERVTAASAAADKRTANASAAASVLSDKQNRQTIEREQRSRNNGMTEEEMLNKYAASAAGAIPAVRLQAQVALGDKQAKRAEMPEGLGGGALDIPALQMPAGTNTPRTKEDVERGLQNSMNMEFAYTPEEQKRQGAARNIRDNALDLRDMTAADLGAKATSKDRTGLEDAITAIFDDKDEGPFTREMQQGEKVLDKAALRENGRMYFGHKMNPGEKNMLKGWSFKLARANPDMAIGSAVNGLMALTAVDAKNPSAQANYTVNVDEAGRGRVVLKDGSAAFNLDGESLQQIAAFRKVKALKLQEVAAKKAGDEETARAVSKESKEYWEPLLPSYESMVTNNVPGRFADDIAVPALKQIGRGAKYIWNALPTMRNDPNAGVTSNPMGD
jgi:hypothetical protein